MLAVQTKREAQSVTQQVELQRKQLEAAEQPFVMPSGTLNDLTLAEGVQRFALTGTNAGGGPALNINGRVEWETGQVVQAARIAAISAAAAGGGVTLMV